MIGKTVLDHWRTGKKRETLALSDVEKQLTVAAMNPDNHREYSQIVDYVGFLEGPCYILGDTKILNDLDIEC